MCPHGERMSRKWELFFCILDARGIFYTTHSNLMLCFVFVLYSGFVHHVGCKAFVDHGTCCLVSTVAGFVVILVFILKQHLCVMGLEDVVHVCRAGIR